MKHIGIDIGTTSICGIVWDDGGRLLRKSTRDNDTAIDGTAVWAKEQDASRIATLVESLLDELVDDDVASIGSSGQMHGIVYVGSRGELLSPL